MDTRSVGRVLLRRVRGLNLSIVVTSLRRMCRSWRTTGVGATPRDRATWVPTTARQAQHSCHARSPYALWASGALPVGGEPGVGVRRPVRPGCLGARVWLWQWLQPPGRPLPRRVHPGWRRVRQLHLMLR